MSPKLNRVIRSAIGGFVSGAAAVLVSQQVDWANINWDAARVIGAAILMGGLTGAWSAIHNYVLDPSSIPSLAPNDPPAE